MKLTEPSPLASSSYAHPPSFPSCLLPSLLPLGYLEESLLLPLHYDKLLYDGEHVSTIRFSSPLEGVYIFL